MIHHIVMIKLKRLSGDAEIRSIREKIKMKLDALPAKIKEIRFYEVGLNKLESERAYDIVLISKFNSMEELKSYAIHSDHLLVLEFIRQHADHVATVDY